MELHQEVAMLRKELSKLQRRYWITVIAVGAVFIVGANFQGGADAPIKGKLVIEPDANGEALIIVGDEKVAHVAIRAVKQSRKHPYPAANVQAFAGKETAKLNAFDQLNQKNGSEFVVERTGVMGSAYINQTNGSYGIQVPGYSFSK